MGVYILCITTGDIAGPIRIKVATGRVHNILNAQRRRARCAVWPKVAVTTFVHSEAYLVAVVAHRADTVAVVAALVSATFGFTTFVAADLAVCRTASINALLTVPRVALGTLWRRTGFYRISKGRY